MSVADALHERLRCGRMLSGDKSSYSRRHPKHEVYFNACGFTEDGKQVWFGDIDLTKESSVVQEAVDAAGEAILITPEQPFRFSGLDGDGRWSTRAPTKEDKARIRRFVPGP